MVPGSFSIGGVNISPATVLAPMAGVTDTVFRRFIRNLGGCGLIMTEFTSADGVLRMLVTAAFSHRRKILSNGLKGLLTPAEIEACGIDSQLRPEALTPAQFGLLAALHSRLYSKAHGRLQENLGTVGSD